MPISSRKARPSVLRSSSNCTSRSAARPGRKRSSPRRPRACCRRISTPAQRIRSAAWSAIRSTRCTYSHSFISSPSGLLPTDFSPRAPLPKRCVVVHPFTPVYLLPLVEVLGGTRSAAETLDAAMQVYAGLGMRPLRVRKEVPGFIADRLLEALWREALHLVNEGVATTGEIDDAIRFGAGIRWSFMGTFLT